MDNGMGGFLVGGAVVVGVIVVLLVGAFLYEVGRTIYFWIAPKVFGWSPQKTSKRRLSSTGVYTEVSGALRSYRRKRSRRGFFVGAIAVGVWFAPVFGAPPTIAAICALGGFILWMFWETEKRLKTMQIRLARMHDKLEQISGTNFEDEHLISELTGF